MLLALKAYFKRLLFPLYLFPIKIISYSLYYLLLFLLKLIWAFLGLIWDIIKYPFKSFKHLLKFIIFLTFFLYMVASVFVVMDYMRNQYGYIGKFLCSFGTKQKLISSVVRVVGGYSEGTGFFISEDQVLTNFHVIADEPSPKIIFPDGSFITPVKIIGDKNADMAVLFTANKYPEKVFPLPDKAVLYDDEPLISAGYPLGTSLLGNATTLRGNFIDFRGGNPVYYLQTNISLVQGMSGGPLVDQCGQVRGINTLSLAGMSMFIAADQAKTLIPKFTDQEIKKINVDPSVSPEKAVEAFYTYLKARKMEDSFKLLSMEYLKKTNFIEWTNRFRDILDVDVIKAERHDKTEDTVFIKFSTKNWVNNGAVVRYYEGTWQTVKEDGVYKMFQSNIIEIENPSWIWFYE